MSLFCGSQPLTDRIVFIGRKGIVVVVAISSMETRQAHARTDQMILTLLSPGFLKSVKPGGGGGIHAHPITPLLEGCSPSNLEVLHYTINVVQPNKKF